MSVLKDIEPEFLSRSEVEIKLGISTATIFRWQKEGTFPKGIKFGSKLMWRISVVEAWINERELA